MHDEGCDTTFTEGQKSYVLMQCAYVFYSDTQCSALLHRKEYGWYIYIDLYLGRNFMF